MGAKRARPQPPAIAHKSQPAPEIEPLVQRHPDSCVPSPALELCGDYPCVVEHQHIAPAQQSRQVADLAVGEGLAVRDHQHPRRIARAHRAQCYAFGREVEIEQVYAHDFGLGQREVFDKLRLSGRWKRGNAQDPLVLSLSRRRRPQVSNRRKSRSI